MFCFFTKFFIFFCVFVFLNSDTEYRKLLSGTYEYEYEEYLMRIILQLINPKIQHQPPQHQLVLLRRLQLGPIYLQPLKKS